MPVPPVRPYMELSSVHAGRRRASLGWIDDRGDLKPQSKLSNGAPMITDMRPRDRYFLYRWWGFIKLEDGPGLLRAQWSVHDANHGALDALIERLKRAESDDRAVELRFFFHGWNKEVYASGLEAAARVEAVQRYRHVEIAQETMMRQRGLDWVERSSDFIRLAFETWERNGECFFKSHLCAWFGSRALVFSPRERDGHLIFNHAGLNSGCVRVYGGVWAQTALGKSYSGHSPDGNYTDKVCPPYEEVLASGEPRLDHIRALIHRGEDDEPLWVPYQRLVLRSQGRDGRPLLVCLSDLTQQIDIPFMAAG